MNLKRFSFLVLIVIAFMALMAEQTAAQSNKKSSTTRKKSIKRAPAEKLLKADPDDRSRRLQGERSDDSKSRSTRFRTTVSMATLSQRAKAKKDKPRLGRLTKAGTFRGDLRSVPYAAPKRKEKPEREGPEPNPAQIGPSRTGPERLLPSISPQAAAAPTPTLTFDGLDRVGWGSGFPPDAVGDVGPNHYIQAINSSIGIYDKLGNPLATLTLDSLMSQGNFGNICDTDNFGDPVVLYDTFEDRWVIADFAFVLDGGNNVLPPALQCFAVSQSGDPVTGGWNFYFIETLGGLGDYPKLGVWPDGIYMSVNMFDYAASGSFQTPRVFALNKAQMYAGAPTVQVITFDAPGDDFTLLPSNARLQTGTPPAGAPNYFVSTWQFLNGLTVYKFNVDWDRPSLSTFTGPDVPLASTSWPNAGVANVPQSGTGTTLDSLQIRAMMQNQYTNIGGTESLWATHTVRRGNTTGFAAPRWYQVNVTGGTVAANLPQAATWDPDGSNVIHRFVPSLSVNRNGDLALGYSTSSNSTFPSIKYAGRLAGDPVDTFSQTETSMFDGTGSQTVTSRWGDYTAMTTDPDGCRFWYTNEYLIVSGANYRTRIGTFSFPGCVALANNGVLEGTVTSSVNGVPLEGSTVSLGARTATTDSNGFYSFSNVPQGLYPAASAELAGFVTSTSANISVSDSSVTTQNFALSPANDAACLTDTTQADFQTGTPSNTDVAANPGNVQLSTSTELDQQNTSVTSNGFGFNSTTWAGQTFTAGESGLLARAELDLFCSGCTGTTPDLTVSIRATAAGVPTGPDLATATIAGFGSGSGTYYAANFTTPTAVTAGTQYAVIVRSVSDPSAGTYAYVCSCTGNSNPYANGSRVTSTNSGSTWTADNTAGGRDLGFRVYVQTGFSASGDLVSGTKDSNPIAPGTTTWGSISWNATVPANTTLTFQVAGSNNEFGPFNFVGPDGSAGTFYSVSGGSVAQFNGLRYLKYKAFFTTTNAAASPILNDVTICYTNPRVWTGAVSTDWNNPANWSSSGPPGAGNAAIIPAVGVLNDPTNSTSVSVASLQLGSGRVVTTGANTLTVTTCDPAAILGGDADSYVNGGLTRCVNNAGPYLFPVGTNSGYSPTTLSGISGSGSFTVRPAEGTLSGTNSGLSIQRYWALTPAGGVTQANVTFTYLDSDVPGGADESAFQFVRRSGGVNTVFSPSSVSVGTNTFTLNNVTAFSDWTLGTLAPTAASVAVTGRVLSREGRGIANAIVTLINSQGIQVAVRTNTLGYFRFNNVAAGQSYTVSAQARNRQFSSKVIDVVDNVAGLDFIDGQ